MRRKWAMVMEYLFDENFCSLCGSPGPFVPFFPGASLRETRCPSCNSSRRTRELVRVLGRQYNTDPDLPLCAQLEKFRDVHIFELQAQGPLHELLCELPYYVCSEYFPDIPSGTLSPSGILCQDASCLSFQNEIFDVVITQDILEHMPDPWKGFQEIQRVLRPDGNHFFTVPVHEGCKTRQRVAIGTEETGYGMQYLLPPVYHKDPLNPDGALVYWDYGDDLGDLLQLRGIQVVKRHIPLYSPSVVCRVITDEDAAAYTKAREENRLASYLLYNPVVFRAFSL